MRVIHEWRLLLGALLVVALVGHCANARADVNLAWSPDQAAAKEPGAWRRVDDSTRVVCGTSSSTGFQSSANTTFGECPEWVWACPADISADSTGGCATEQQVAKDQIARIAAPPPEPDARFTAWSVTPGRVNAGEFVTMTWATEGMFYCYDIRTELDQPTSGALSIQLPQTGDVGIECSAYDGTAHRWHAQVIVVDIAWVAPPPPPCWPLPGVSTTLYEATTVDGHGVKVWGCDTTAGFVWRPYGYDPSRLLERLACAPSAMWAALTTQLLDAAWRACVTRELSPTEKELADVLTAKWKPRFIVQPTSTVMRRPVYTENPDGTRGAQLRIDGVLQYILVGEPCNGSRRLLGITTRYHLVDGRTSQQGQTLPSRSYAQCLRQNPPADGWPGP
jgi:hypothetical protein